MTLVDKLNEMYEREEWNPEWVAEIGTALKSSGTQPTIDNNGYTAALLPEIKQWNYNEGLAIQNIFLIRLAERLNTVLKPYFA